MKKIVVRGTQKTAHALVEYLKENPCPNITESCTIEPTVVTLYVPDDLFDKVLSKIKELPDINEHESIIEVSSPDFVISPLLDEIKAGLAEKPKEKPKDRPIIEDLVESAERHIDLDTSKILLAAIAGMVALIGLFLNNVGIIIGAMLISPLLGPIYAFAVNTAVGNSRNVFNCVKILTVLLVMVIAISFIITALLSFVIPLTITSEISSRLDANPVYILMAFLLGFATIFALSEKIPEGVAGVAVAAALLPPAVVFGISLYLLPGSAFLALTLTLQNVIGLLAGSIGAVLILQVRPRVFLNN
ncbi:MAG: TIGR00341 family protein, partial [Methanoregula sp.]